MKFSDIKNSNRFYVYALLDTRKSGKYIYGEYEFDYEPFYIGKGQLNRAERHFNEKESKLDKNTFKQKIIYKIKTKTNNLPKIIKIKENLEDIEALKLEIYLIKLIGRRDLNLGPLTNLTDGGDGISGNKRSYEFKKKLSESRIGSKNPMYGKKQSKETVELRRQKLIGQKRTQDQIENIRNSNIKYKYKVISPYGEELIINSLRHFSIEHGLSDAKMTRVANGNKNHYKGWVVFIIGKEYLRDKWKYKKKRIDKY